MIDTIRLELDEIRLTKPVGFEIFGPQKKLNSKVVKNQFSLFLDEKGKVVKGSRAYFNDDKFSINIVPQLNRHNYIVRRYLNTNMSKVFDKDNSDSIPVEKLSLFFTKLQLYLDKIGIQTKIKNAELVGLHLFVDIDTQRHFKDYKLLFEMSKNFRLIPNRDWYTTDYKGNKQHELCIYDKFQEMIANDRNVDNISDKRVRLEYRMKNKSKIKNVIGFASVQDILDNEIHYNTILFRSIKKYLFNIDRKILSKLNSITVKDEILEMSKSSENQWLANYIKTLGYRYLLENAGSVDTAIEWIESTGKCAKSSRHKNELTIAEKNKIKIVKNKSGIDYIELYEELLSKVKKKLKIKTVPIKKIIKQKTKKDDSPNLFDLKFN